jgi:ABC-type Fe3+-hydroxamate transport system substrate-binding protein
MNIRLPLFLVLFALARARTEPPATTRDDLNRAITLPPRINRVITLAPNLTDGRRVRGPRPEARGPV